MEKITLFSSAMARFSYRVQISRFFAEAMPLPNRKFPLIPLGVALLLAALPISKLNAQNTTVRGVVLEEKYKLRMAGVAVVNVRTAEGIRTNRAGAFSLEAKRGDTLVFSQPLFSFYKWVVPAKVFDTLVVVMKPQNLLLNEVPVKGYRITMNQPVPIDVLPPARPSGADIRTPQAVAPTLANPIDFFYEMFGNRPRQLRQLRALLEAEAYREQLNKSRNRNALFALTGLEGEKVEQFLLYCRLNQSQIDASTDYQLLESLLACFAEFEDLGDDSSPGTPLD
jgi:hypothetical protein